MLGHDLSISSIPVRDVFVVGKRHRPLNEGAVDILCESIKSLGGVKTPISVVYDDSLHDPETGEDCGGFRLIAGNHRLQAARRLGMDAIPAIQWPKGVSLIDVEMWEIAENLHRVGLTKEERDEHIRRYAALMEEKAKEAGSDKLSVPAYDSRGQRKSEQQQEGIASKIAKVTGLSQRTIRRALSKIVGVPSNTPSPPVTADRSEKDFDRLCRIWAGASADTRARFKEWSGLR